MDVHDWGVGKIKNEGNFSQRALTNLEEILNETADAHLPEEYIGEQHREDIQNEAEEGGMTGRD